MNKTEKELAVEFVVSYISAWNSTQGASPFTFEDSLDMLEKAYSKISSLTPTYPDEENEVMY